MQLQNSVEDRRDVLLRWLLPPNARSQLTTFKWRIQKHRTYRRVDTHWILYAATVVTISTFVDVYTDLQELWSPTVDNTDDRYY